MDIIRFDEMKKTWHQIAKQHSGDIGSSFKLELYKKMLDVFHPGEFYYYIVNIGRVETEYVSDGIERVLGVLPCGFSVEYIVENIHPDDAAHFIAYEKKVTEFFNNLPPEKILKYKVCYDFRLRCADGSYKWLLHQVTTIQSDNNGSVIRVLGVHTNITHLKTDNTPAGLSFIGLEGEPSFHNYAVSPLMVQPSGQIFSMREKDVLRLVLMGKSSFEIAGILHISKHTVDSHRKKIFAKSNCNNLVELGAKVIREKWL